MKTAMAEEMEEVTIYNVLGLTQEELKIMGRGDVGVYIIDDVNDLINIMGFSAITVLAEGRQNWSFAGATAEGWKGIYVWNPQSPMDLFVTMFHELGHIATSPEGREREQHEIVMDEYGASMWGLKRLASLGFDEDVLLYALNDFGKALETYTDEHGDDGILKQFSLEGLDVIKKRSR